MAALNFLALHLNKYSFIAIRTFYPNLFFLHQKRNFQCAKVKVKYSKNHTTMTLNFFYSFILSTYNQYFISLYANNAVHGAFGILDQNFEFFDKKKIKTIQIHSIMTSHTIFEHLPT